MNRTFASLLGAFLALLGIEIVTGLILAPTYSSSLSNAYTSVAAIHRNPFLHAIRGIHHWSSALLIVLGGAAIVAGMLTASYRSPHRGTWLLAVTLTLLAVGFQLTGHLLPMDQHDVRTAVIETGIAGGAPVIGPAQQSLLRGGAEVGEKTLALWTAVHMYVFGVLVLALGWLLLSRLRREDEVKRPALAAGGFGIALVIALAFALPAPLGKPAGPTDFSDYQAAPEWYVLPLHKLLDIFQSINPKLAFIGSMVIPGIAVAFLLALPWIGNRIPTKAVRALGMLGAACFILLAGLAAKQAAPLTGNQLAALDPAGSSQPEVLEPALVAQGKALFTKSGCTDCHRVAGKGGHNGPDLTTEGTKGRGIDWHVAHLKAPGSKTPGSTMPNFAFMKDGDLRALAEYLESLR